MSKETRFRAAPARGIAGKVDRENGIIFGVAVNTEGEALGHGVHLEREFVEEVAKQGNGASMGIKSRFGHPNMSSSALGTYLGRLKTFSVEESASGSAVTRANLHLSKKTASDTPHGNLYEYIMNLAEEDPEAFGLSIVFKASGQYRKNGQGEKVWKYVDAKYNPEFVKTVGKTFIGLDKLTHGDAVDQPAANTDGLFSAFSDSPAKAVTEFLDDNPDIWDTFKDVSEEELTSIFSAFRERFSANRAGSGHTANKTKKEYENMPNEKNPEVVPVEQLEAAKAKASKQAGDQLKTLLSTFGQDVAIAAFDEGLSVEQVKASQYDAQSDRIKELEAEVGQLKSKKPAVEGEQTPIKHREEEGNAHDAFNAEVQAGRDKGLDQAAAYSAATAKYPVIANQICNARNV